MTAVLIAAWCVGGIVTWPFVVRALMRWREHEWPRLEVDRTDWKFAAGIGVVLSLLWPVIVPVALLVSGLGRVAEWIGQ